jgi:AmmeMemoRadiSam system protein B
MIRPPAVAGRFYVSDPKELAREVDAFAAGSPGALRAIACLVPHAGYMYSGHVAGAVYAELDLPSRFILVGPRHFPRGEAMAILSEGSWRMPFGNASIDAPLAAELARACPHLREDSVAHEREHSLEVQIPFLQRLAKDFQFVPVVLGVNRYPLLEELGHALARVIARQEDRIQLVASSDMNHYENDAVTRVKDQRAIERILALDPRGLFDVVQSERISMCGYAAAVAVLVAARDLGANAATLVKYATSGDISGDYEQVVGYAGITIQQSPAHSTRAN